jgi:hypothetical protein
MVSGSAECNAVKHRLVGEQPLLAYEAVTAQNDQGVDIMSRRPRVSGAPGSNKSDIHKHYAVNPCAVSALNRRTSSHCHVSNCLSRLG